MRHLYNSKAQVLRLVPTIQFGDESSSWQIRTEVLDPYAEPGYMWCRLDMALFRPGKDQPAPIEAGVAPDRTGVLFCDFTPYLKAEDRVVMVAGPVEGTFEIRTVPDLIQGYALAHHIEVSVIEVAQSMTGRYEFPGD